MIPLRNLYWVFAYAWELFPGGEVQDVGGETCPDLPNLFARLLLDGMRRLARRGLDRRYVTEVEETRSPRGRLLLDLMVKGNTLQRGVAVCAYDELTADVLHNQILKATVCALARTRNITRDHRKHLAALARGLPEVSDIRVTSGIFARVQLSRNTRQYRPLLALCALVNRALIPEPGGEGFRFAEILQDDVTMSAVFEAFLRAFYRLDQHELRVTRENLHWNAAGSEGDLAYLPLMRTDITLRSSTRTVVIDAKYYSEVFSQRYGRPKVHAANLYQLTTYLRHTASQACPEGILIYACDRPLPVLRFEVEGHGIAVAPVDFSRGWSAIRAQLLGLVSPTQVMGGAGLSR